MPHCKTRAPEPLCRSLARAQSLHMHKVRSTLSGDIYGQLNGLTALLQKVYGCIAVS